MARSAFLCTTPMLVKHRLIDLRLACVQTSSSFMETLRVQLQFLLQQRAQELLSARAECDHLLQDKVALFQEKCQVIAACSLLVPLPHTCFCTAEEQLNWAEWIHRSWR